MKTLSPLFAIILFSVCVLQQSNAQSWVLGGNNNANGTSKLGTLKNFPLMIYTHNIERMRIDVNGNIGIGTTTPAYKLSLSGSNAAVQVNAALLQTPNNSRNFIINAGRGQVSTGLSSGNLSLQVDGSDQGGALFAGNVGIGTTTPTIGKFVVEGMVGNTVAVFKNSLTTSKGLALVTDNPGVYFNSYWNSGNKALSQGYTGLLNFDPNTGNLYLGTSSTQASGAGQALSAPSRLLIDKNGNVGIGTTAPTNKLDVCGTIRAKEVLVQTGWCDYVFNKDYKLRSLNDVESYINQNKHLPDVPSATEVEDKGIKVAQMDSILIKKLEELTLYVIDQNKQIQQLQNKVIQLEKDDADKKN